LSIDWLPPPKPLLQLPLLPLLSPPPPRILEPELPPLLSLRRWRRMLLPSSPDPVSQPQRLRPTSLTSSYPTSAPPAYPTSRPSARRTRLPGRGARRTQQRASAFPARWQWRQQRRRRQHVGGRSVAWGDGGPPTRRRIYRAWAPERARTAPPHRNPRRGRVPRSMLDLKTKT
jgi:hypothetical protein